MHPLRSVRTYNSPVKYDTPSNPLTERYASREMSYLFSPNSKFRTWRRLWIALAEAERELGLPITEAQIAELKANANDINFEDAERREREVRHDVMAHVHAYGLQAPSALIIAFTLLCLLACYRAFAESPGFSRGEQYLVVLPLSALAAWLTAATIVNISAVLVYHGIDAGDASTTIGAGIVIVGGLIASAAIWTGRGNPWYALVFLWALAGIHAASAGDDPEIAAAALGSALVVALTTLLRLLRRPEDRSHWFQAAGAKASTHSR